jgi:rhamnogalacturonan endolyase
MRSTGTWRGRKQAFTFPVAASTLKAGENTLTISVASGSTASDWWLTPNFVFDYVRFL